MLIDTHVLIWYLSGDPTFLGKKAIKNLKELPITVSTASLMEVALKKRKGKLDIPDVSEIIKVLTNKSIQIIDITSQHLASIPSEEAWSHADPFDLLLVAQAISENLDFMTNDLEILNYTAPKLTLVDGRV